jgi:phosphoglycolate phosphatase-like HAD superfamily hydrolase
MQLLKNFDAQAIIFDKDGTLIDFDFMWGTWTLQLAEQFQAITGLDVCEALCCSYGYDLSQRKVLRDGNLTYTSMWRLKQMMIEVAQCLGLTDDEARSAVEEAWFVPDPVALAKPFTDVHKLFHNIQERGVKIAIATTDDRSPTEAMLRAFGVKELVNTMVCADDGIKAKPAPDMVTTICSRMNVDVRKTILVGDTVADMQMARSAGAGCTIGVLSGVGLLENLTANADMLIDTIDSLQDSFLTEVHSEIYVSETTEGVTGLNPDPAY